MKDADIGATPAPAAPTLDSPCLDPATGRKHQHHWVWLWAEGTWTDKVRCTNCGSIKLKTRFEEGT